MRRWTAIGVMCGLVLQAPAAAAPAGPARQELPVSQLLGLTPSEIRERLAPETMGWPPAPAFQVAAADGVLSFVALDALMTDPVLAQRATAFRTAGDPPPDAPAVQCAGVLTRDDGTQESAQSVMFLFRDGRLEGAAQTIAEPLVPLPHALDPAALQAAIRRPGSSPFVARSGELPLEDGLGFLDRWRRRPLSPADRLRVACAPPRSRPPSAAARSFRGLDAGDLQGLALLPFAVVLPVKNAQRAAARRDGAALLASLSVRQSLGEAAAAFAARHAGVRAQPGARSDYAVLTIDLGAYPGRNLSNFNDVALVGVREGRVEWISPPSALGPGAALLCLDGAGVLNAPRRGCSGGRYAP